MTQVITIATVISMSLGAEVAEELTKEGIKSKSYLEKLFAEGYKVTHLTSTVLNGVIYNTYVLVKENKC